MQIIQRLLVAYVARAEDLLYLPWHKELLKFRGQVVGTVWDVQVADDEDEDHGQRSEVEEEV